LDHPDAESDDISLVSVSTSTSKWSANHALISFLEYIRQRLF
jgi:hypothetical protein